MLKLGKGCSGSVHVTEAGTVLKRGRIYYSEYDFQRRTAELGFAPEAIGFVSSQDSLSGKAELEMEYLPQYRTLSRARYLRDSDFKRLVQAVFAMHEAGFVHRDLHSDNVLVAKGRPALIIDFGHAEWHSNVPGNSLYAELDYLLGLTRHSKTKLARAASALFAKTCYDYDEQTAICQQLAELCNVETNYA